MSCQTPYRDDSAQVLLFKIASCIEAGGGGGGVAGVVSFNGRTGVVTLTSGDVTTALGFTPLSTAAGDARYVLKAGDTMTGSLNIFNSAVLVASDPALDITQTWSNGAVTFTGLNSNITNTASSTNSNLFNFQVDGVDRFNFTPGGSFRVVRQDASDSGMNLFLRKRGNAGSATGAVANDSTIGSVRYSGWDGAAFADGSRISGLASEAWTGIAHGSRIDLYTTPVGSVTEQIILRLDSTGQAKFLDGTAALPSLTFQSDPDTGLYRIGANSFGLSANGVLILTTNTTGIDMTAGLSYQYNAVNMVRAQTAIRNYFFGPSGNLTMTGVDNLAMGSGNLVVNTTGTRNVALGNSSLGANTTGEGNVGIGFQTLLTNVGGMHNIALGDGALQAATGPFGSVAIGRSSLTANTSAVNNTGIGYRTLATATTGDYNTAIGFQSLELLTFGLECVGIGINTLRANTTGSSNTAVGSNALLNVTTGSTNTAIGYLTGLGITTGSNNTILGGNVAGLAAGLSNNIIISDGAGNRRINVDSAGLVGINTIAQNSTLHVEGSLALGYVEKTGAYTATVADFTINCTANTFTVSLPTAVGIEGRIYVVKNTGVGVITIDPNGAETIDGAATSAVAAGVAVMIQSTGANWIII